MPRKSKAALSIAHIGPGAQRLEPPATLSARAAEIFRFTVLASSYDHFQPVDSPLLCRYCESAALTERAAVELAAHPVVDGRVSPWLAIQKEHVRLLAMLAMRLKIGPKSRRPDGRRASKPVREPSYYELMDMKGRTQ